MVKMAVPGQPVRPVQSAEMHRLVVVDKMARVEHQAIWAELREIRALMGQPEPMGRPDLAARPAEMALPAKTAL